MITLKWSTVKKLVQNRFFAARQTVWPDWAIYYTLGNWGNKDFAQIAHIIRLFCKGVKIFDFV